MTPQEELIAEARRWIGVPFCHQGRSRQGVDCLGLLIMVAATRELMFAGKHAHAHDTRIYSHRPDTETLMEGLCTHMKRIAVQDMQPADIVLMRVDGLPQHLAIISDYPEAGHLGMIHAYAPARKVVEHRLCAYWESSTQAAFRLPQFI